MVRTSGKKVICPECNVATMDFYPPDYIKMQPYYYKCRFCGYQVRELEDLNDSEV